MATLTNDQVAQARAVLKALQAALDAVEGFGGVRLPEVLPVEVAVSEVPPSESVAALCAASRRAREAFERETEIRRVAALVIAVLAEVGKTALGPAIGLLTGL